MHSLESIWNKAVQGDLPSIDRVLKTLERRAKLLGLNMPVRYDILIKEEAERLAQKYGIDPAAIIKEAEEILRGNR